MTDNLKLIKQIRKIATKTLYKTIQLSLPSSKPVSEVDLHSSWLKELQKYKEIFPEGWYLPPPNGIAVLLAPENNPARLDFKSLRKKHNWPRKDIFLDKKHGLAFLYSSPIGMTGILGDIEVTLYFGKNKEIKEYLKLYFRILQKIVEQIKVGKTTFKDLFDYSEFLFDKYNLENAIVSMTDPTSDNIGHSIPFVDESMTTEEKKILAGKDWVAACKMVCNKRLFLNSIQDTIIQPNMAFTIEPGVKIKGRDDMPFIAFHTMVLIDKKGKIEWIRGFDEIFKLASMDYLLKAT